jgi:hypothetical protein
MPESDTPLIPQTEPAIGSGEASAARQPNPFLRDLKVLCPGLFTEGEAGRGARAARWDDCLPGGAGGHAGPCRPCRCSRTQPPILITQMRNV